MKPSPAKKPKIRIVVVEGDPLRFVGIRALFDSETDLDLSAASLPELAANGAVDLVLLSSRSGQNLFDAMAGLKASRPDLKIIVSGSEADDETILKVLAAGAKGYVDEAAAPVEFVQAIRMVHQGSVWAPRRVLSIFIERVTSAPGRIFPAGRVTFTEREKEVLELLVAGRSNKEIGSPLGICERTVKAHVAKLMRKVGVQNRISLSIHAITHSLVSGYAFESTRQQDSDPVARSISMDQPEADLRGNPRN
jgi:DNA-binding NarL/FixJ family response regulator